MTSTPRLKTDDQPGAYHEDYDPANFPKDKIVNVGESDWCVICGQDSRKKRKRYTCNTYESHKPLSKTLRKMLRKYDKDKGISNTHATAKLSCFRCTRCNSKACMSCVTTVYSELKINDDHSADNWFHAIQAGMRH